MIVARAALRWYVLAELLQLALLFGSTWQLIASRGALGAAQAYLLTYGVYFAVCVGAFEVYRRRP